MEHSGGESIGRRDFLRRLGQTAVLAAAGPAAGGLLTSCASAASHDAARPTKHGHPDTATTSIKQGLEPPAPGTMPLSVAGVALRPPAVPLAVRDPYVSAWLEGTDLAAGWATGWAGAPMSICGLVRVDGHTYLWCGDLAGLGLAIPRLTQTALEVTPTRSLFTLEGAGIRLVAEWLSPVEPGDPRLQSVPLSLLTVAVSSADGNPHAVTLYCEMSGQWASWIGTDQIVWETSETAARHWSVQLASQQPLAENAEMAAWGSAVFSTLPSGAATSYESGASWSVRASFAGTGRLSDSNDTAFRAIDVAEPAFALAQDLGPVGSVPVMAHFSIGHVETPAIEYMGQLLEPLWKASWNRWQSMVDEFLTSVPATRSRSISLDEAITAGAQKAGGPEYAALCALALRQAYGGCQLVVGPSGKPWAFLKEISSDDDISTVDIIFDSCPVFLQLDPGYIPMLIEPVLHYAASSRWSEPYSPHSLGHWPLANGNPVGASSEPMPMWESGAMLVMAAVWATRVPSETARTFLARFEPLWTKWAELLMSQLPSPPAQLTTIDFLGSAPHNTNLAVLGIVGLAAAGEIASRLGRGKQGRQWAAEAKKFASQWERLATDPSGRHLDCHMGSAGTWSDLYNAYWDAVLGTALVGDSVASMQAAWYRSHIEAFGLPVQSSTPGLARVDQQLITAAWLHDYPIGPEMIKIVARYLGHTGYLAAMPDTYNPKTGGPGLLYDWRARPVVGAAFGLLLLKGQGH
ncbi:MAG: glutaminase family protein [Acidimicrobiales bacterium]